MTSEGDFFAMVEKKNEPKEEPAKAPVEARPAQPPASAEPKPAVAPQATAQAELSQELMEDLRNKAIEFGVDFTEVVKIAQSILADPALQAQSPKLRDRLVAVNVKVRLQQKQKTKQIPFLLIGKDKNYWKSSGNISGNAYGIFTIEENGETSHYLGRISLNGEDVEKLNKAILLARYTPYVEIPEKRDNGTNFLVAFSNELTDFENPEVLSISYPDLLERALGISLAYKIEGEGGCGLSALNDKGYPLPYDLKALLVIAQSPRKIASTPDDLSVKISTHVATAFSLEGDEQIQLWIPDFPEFLNYAPLKEPLLVLGTIAERRKKNQYSDENYVMNVIAVVPLSDY